jgi:hypothetical protein
MENIGARTLLSVDQSQRNSARAIDEVWNLGSAGFISECIKRRGNEAVFIIKKGR